MNMYIINSEDDFKTAKARLDVMAGAIPGTVEAKELRDLTKAVVDYLKKQNQGQNIKRDLAPDKRKSGIF